MTKEAYKPKIICSDGFIGGISYSLTGPPDQINAIVTFIRNLTRMSGGQHNKEYLS